MIQTTSLDLSKRLKELDFPQDTSFYWIDGISDEATFGLIYRQEDDGINYDLEGNGIIASPSAGEILDRLPELLNTPKLGSLTISKYKDEYCVWYSGSDRESIFGPIMDFADESLADAVGKMYIYLKEKKLI